jgi:hypothetical protein
MKNLRRQMIPYARHQYLRLALAAAVVALLVAPIQAYAGKGGSLSKIAEFQPPEVIQALRTAEVEARLIELIELIEAIEATQLIEPPASIDCEHAKAVDCGTKIRWQRRKASVDAPELDCADPAVTCKARTQVRDIDAGVSYTELAKRGRLVSIREMLERGTLVAPVVRHRY